MDVENEKSYKYVFDILDQHKDGTLNISEFSQAVRALGLSPTNSDISDLLKNQEIDQDGVINFNEFKELVRLLQEDYEADSVDILKMYQKCYPNTDGYITSAELRKIFGGQGEPLQDDEVDQILSYFDPEKTDKIHFESLIKGLLA